MDRVLRLHVLLSRCIRRQGQPVRLLHTKERRPEQLHSGFRLVKCPVLFLHGVRGDMGRVLLLPPARVQHPGPGGVVVLQPGTHLQGHEGELLPVAEVRHPGPRDDHSGFVRDDMGRLH